MCTKYDQNTKLKSAVKLVFVTNLFSCKKYSNNADKRTIEPVWLGTFLTFLTTRWNFREFVQSCSSRWMWAANRGVEPRWKLLDTSLCSTKVWRGKLQGSYFSNFTILGKLPVRFCFLQFNILIAPALSTVLPNKKCNTRTIPKVCHSFRIQMSTENTVGIWIADF